MKVKEISAFKSDFKTYYSKVFGYIANEIGAKENQTIAIFGRFPTAFFEIIVKHNLHTTFVYSNMSDSEKFECMMNEDCLFPNNDRSLYHKHVVDYSSLKIDKKFDHVFIFDTMLDFCNYSMKLDYYPVFIESVKKNAKKTVVLVEHYRERDCLTESAILTDILKAYDSFMNSLSVNDYLKVLDGINQDDVAKFCLDPLYNDNLFCFYREIVEQCASNLSNHALFQIALNGLKIRIMEPRFQNPETYCAVIKV